jgi:hypothetical protein
LWLPEAVVAGVTLEMPAVAVVVVLVVIDLAQ